MSVKLSAKKEKFALLMATGDPKTGKPLTQSEAYRLAFKPKKMKAKSVHELASRLMAEVKVASRIQELMQPIITKATVTREQWLEKMEGYFHADVRKMFSGPGDLIEIPDLGEHEANMINGFELVENFTKVGDQAEHTGYTKKVKLESKLKAMLEYGKVRGFYSEKSEEPTRGMVIIIQRDGPPAGKKAIDVTPKVINPTGEAKAKLPARIERA